MELLESSEFVDVDGDGKYLLQTVKEGKAGGAIVRETGQHQLTLRLGGSCCHCPQRSINDISWGGHEDNLRLGISGQVCYAATHHIFLGARNVAHV